MKETLILLFAFMLTLGAAKFVHDNKGKLIRSIPAETKIVPLPKYYQERLNAPAAF